MTFSACLPSAVTFFKQLFCRTQVSHLVGLADDSAKRTLRLKSETAEALEPLRGRGPDENVTNRGMSSSAINSLGFAPPTDSSSSSTSPRACASAAAALPPCMMKATCFFFVLELLHPFPDGELFKRAVFSHVYGRDTCLAVGIPPVGLWRTTVYRFCLADS